MKRRNFLKTMAVLAGSGLIRLRFPFGRLWAQVAQTFAIPPTVHHVTENSAVIYFRLSQPVQAGSVEVYQDEVLVQEIPFTTEDSLRVQIEVHDLAPASSYTYRVLADGQVPPVYGLDLDWDNLSFRTPPFEFPLTFAAVGDSGFGDPVTETLGAQMAQHDLDFFMHLGDVVYWMYQYENDHFMNWNMKYFMPFAGMLQRMPHYPTYGNHEGDGPARLDGLASYFWIFPPFNADQTEDGLRSWYSFEFNNIQFLSMNSQLIYSFRALHNEQTEWMKAKLQREDVLYTVIFFHVPPYTSAGLHQWDGMYLEEEWVSIFEEYNVPLVLNGHAHNYERLEKNGVTYLVAGSGSAHLYGIGERWRHSQSIHVTTAYPVVELYPDRIHITAYDVEGNILDDVDLSLSAT